MPARTSDTGDRYAALLNALDTGYCLLEVEFDAGGQAVDYHFVEANPLFEAYTGLSNAMGRSVRELLPDIEPFWIERYGEVARTRQPVRFEQRSEVMGRVFEVHAFPVGSPADRLVGLLFNDVTQDRRREAGRQFLAEVAQVFDSEASLDGIMASVGSRLGDFLGTNSCLLCHIDEANDTITTSYGWTRAGEPNLVRTFRTSDYLGERFILESRAHRPAVVCDTQSDPRADAAAYAALNIRSFVTVPYHVDGVWTHCFAVTDAQPREWTAEEVEFLQSFARLVISRLERARADAALRTSEARFRAMADAVPQIIWITDGEGRVEFFNRQWRAYTGLASTPETAADVATAALHPDDAAATMRRFGEAIAAGSTFEIEHRIRSASGEYRWFLVRAEPERDPATGSVRRWYGASVDIHDRRTVEQALAETDRRKDEFLATLAHELRNPLAPIRTGLSLLEMDPLPETAAHTRGVMTRQLGHMVRLIDDLLDVSRINSNKIQLRKEALDVRSAIEEAIEANRPLVDAAGHRLFVSMPSGPLYVEGDRTRLVQVIGNLLSNAAKYTPRGGRIEVSAESCDGQVRMQVRDTGIGIDAAVIGGIFDMFAQVAGHTDRTQGGLGIGLALVRRLVEMHGGAVTAHSAGAGQGSTFTVALPAAADPAADGPAARSPQAVAPVALDILVVDDNIDAAEMLKAVLDAGGHRVRVAHTGEDALAMLDGQGTDVVFLDIGLPGMDGYEVVRRLRADPIQARTTLVALTGWGSEADRGRAFESGFDHHLTKPVDPSRIIDLLSHTRADRRPGGGARG